MGFWKRIYWENILFLILTHALGVLGILYAVSVKFSWWTLGLAALWFVLCALSISAGYHRLFSHRAYKCGSGVKLFHLLFGAASWQSSAFYWAADHREHHAHTDHEGDPYDITKGFWWAHWGWLCFRNFRTDYEHAKDLRDDSLVAFQDRHYLALALFIGMLVPTAIAMAWGDAAGALLLCGWTRLMVQYHASFAINSVAHTFGTKPYSKWTSARDSTAAAILTMGEGYHNYHHRFPSDYRNGIRFWHFDPSKWMIFALSKAGFAWDLKRTPPDVVEKAMETAEYGP